MNILLAFKAEPDLSMLAQEAWLAPRPDLSWVRYQVGADEQAAAEITLEQKQLNPALTLSALTIGEERGDYFMRQLYALGFAHLARIVPPPRRDLRFAPQHIAAMLVDWQTHNPQSLILVGSQSSEGNNGQTGFWLAEKLGWPVLAGVVDFSLDTQTMQAEVLLVQDDERLRCRIKLPAVFIVASDGRYSLRVPGIRQKLAASKAEIVCTEIADSGATDERTVTLKREYSQRAGVQIEGATAQEKAQQLYERYLCGRLPR